MDINKYEDLFDPNAIFIRSEIIKRILSDVFDNPQNSMKFVHVTGTNGKGSVSTMISSVLISSGYKTGLFTSPSVKSFMERIKVNDVPMPFEKYKMVRDKIMEAIPKILECKFDINRSISEFTITTVAALEYFRENNVDIAVLEAGIGGFKDSTNIIESPLVSVITSVSLDHTNTLGKTVEEIAFQKSGIIKPMRPVVVSAGQSKSVYDIIRKTAVNNSSEVIIPNPEDIRVISTDIENGTKFRYKDINLKMGLLGRHQIENALTALTAIETLKKDINIPICAIKDGIQDAFINARLEILSRNPLVILDGAHNESGIKSLANFVKEYLTGKKILGIVGICKDKNSVSEFPEIIPLFSEVYPVEIPRFPRSMKLSKLTNIISKYSENVTPFHDPEDAINHAVKLCDKNSSVVIFGSLYLARRIIRNPNISQILQNIH